MEENTTAVTGTEELSAETLAAFDEGWDDLETPVVTEDAQDDGDTDTDEPGNDTGSEETEDADADQQDAGGDESGEGNGAEDGTETESESKGDEGESPDQGETFHLKHLGEERTVGRDEVMALAQKGLDYDRIREQRDKYLVEHQFLQELAESRDGDIESLMDETRTKIIIGKAQAEGKEIDPSVAAAQAVRARLQPAAEEPEQPSPAARPNEAVTRFMEAFPTVKAEDIPASVWKEVKENGGDLVGAYRGYENRKLAEENKQLQKELETLKQQQKNKERSTGSTKSAGSGNGRRSAFDEGWDAEF